MVDPVSFVISHFAYVLRFEKFPLVISENMSTVCVGVSVAVSVGTGVSVKVGEGMVVLVRVRDAVGELRGVLVIVGVLVTVFVI